jgi:hypothetical protein
MNQLDERFKDLRVNLDRSLTPATTKFEARPQTATRIAIIVCGLLVLGVAFGVRQFVGGPTWGTVATGGDQPEIVPIADLPSIECVFTKPDLMVRMSPEGVWIPRQLNGVWTNILEMPVTSGSIDRTLTATFTQPAEPPSTAASTPTRLTVSAESGLDDGSTTWEYTHSAVLTGDGLPAEFTGGCSVFPRGSVPRKIHGVEGQMDLTLRTEPHASSPAISSLTADQSVWTKPFNGGSNRDGWTEVSIKTNPSTETGYVRVLTGWLPEAPVTVTGYDVTTTCRNPEAARPTPTVIFVQPGPSPTMIEVDGSNCTVTVTERKNDGSPATTSTMAVAP